MDINNNSEQSRKNVDATSNTAPNQGQENPMPSQGSHANDGRSNAQFVDGFSISFQGRGGVNICRGRGGWEISGSFGEGRGSRGWYNNRGGNARGHTQWGLRGKSSDLTRCACS